MAQKAIKVSYHSFPSPLESMLNLSSLRGSVAFKVSKFSIVYYHVKRYFPKLLFHAEKRWSSPVSFASKLDLKMTPAGTPLGASGWEWGQLEWCTVEWWRRNTLCSAGIQSLSLCTWRGSTILHKWSINWLIPPLYLLQDCATTGWTDPDFSMHSLGAGPPSIDDLETVKWDLNSYLFCIDPLDGYSCKLGHAHSLDMTTKLHWIQWLSHWCSLKYHVHTPVLVHFGKIAEKSEMWWFWIGTITCSLPICHNT